MGISQLPHLNPLSRNYRGEMMINNMPHHPTDVPCPTCEAAAGSRCFNRARGIARYPVHAARLKAYRKFMKEQKEKQNG